MGLSSTLINDKTLEPFIRSIRHNCDISDASGSKIFSICGMALRLRDLNKWEKGLQPWEENDPAELVGWIDQKEQEWEKTEHLDFVPLPLLEYSFDPFDTVPVNHILSAADLFYGAGYAHSLKPTFILADIDRAFDLDGIRVVILGRERVRDLLTIPALNQDGAIIIRRDAARLFFWDQMAYLKKSGKRFLSFALKECGVADPSDIDSRKRQFNRILAVQEQTYIHHEVGEIKDRVFDRSLFREMVSRFPHTPVELLARTVKDLLADTGPFGTLQHIVATRNAAALGFYAAFQDGLFKPLFPRLRPAVEKFVADRDWDAIAAAQQEGFATAGQYARDLAALYTDAVKTGHVDTAADTIHEALVKPLIEQTT